jgi:hypothetical protein
MSLLEEWLEQRGGLNLVVPHHGRQKGRPAFDDGEVAVRIESILARQDPHALLHRAADGVDAEHLALQVGELADAAVGPHHGGVVIVPVETEGEQLVHDGDRYARLENRVGHGKRRGKAAIQFSGHQRRRCVSAAGEAYPLDLVGLAEVLHHLGLFLHEEMGADRDVGADPELRLFLGGSNTRKKHGNGRDQRDETVTLHEGPPLDCSSAA